MSATMQIEFSQNRANTSNNSGVKQCPLYIASFELKPTFSTLASNTTRKFVELWSLRMTAW